MRSSLPQDRMPEAEVSLRLAFHLLSLPGSEGSAQVAIDGAQVRVGKDEIFPMSLFLKRHGWEQVEQIGKNPWQGQYRKAGSRLTIHSTPGVGDVVATVGTKRVRAECKGGPLIRSPSSREYPILRELLGQALTVARIHDDDISAVAVPRSDKFSQLAGRWRDAPLVIRSQIQIVLVGRDGTVEGLHLS
jgi:hypothetical protein